MIFLNPTILLGLLAAAIPIAIHFLNLRKLKRIEFSSLIFLKEIQKSNIKRLKLKQWLLLLLRVLIILFLVMAFSRPTLESTNISGISSVSKSSCVIVIDNSLSMSVLDNNETIFNKAKLIAKEIIKNLQEGDEIKILLSSDINSTNQFSTDHKNTISFIEGLSPSYSNRQLSNTINDGIALVSETQNLNKELYVISDFRKVTFATDNNVSQLNIGDINIYHCNLHNPVNTNLTVTSIKSINQIFEMNKPLEFSAEIKNYSSNTTNTSVVSLFVNGQRKGQKSVSVKPNSSEELLFNTTLEQNGILDISIAIEDDEMTSDNKRYISLYIPEKINVLLLANNNSESAFIQAVISSLNINNFINFSVNNTDQFQFTNLETIDLIIYLSDKLSNNNKLKSYVENGGNILAFPSSDKNSLGYREFLKSINLSYNFQLIELGTNDNKDLIEYVNKQHPLFANLFIEKNNNEIPFSTPAFSRYYNFKSNKVNSIISLDDNTNLISEYDFNKGKVVIVNTPLTIEWSDFPVKSIFAPLLIKSVLYLTSRNNEINEVLSGESFTVETKNLAQQLIITLPNKSNEIVNLDKTQLVNNYTLPRLQLPGNYQLHSGNNLIDHFSVNIDPKESDFDDAINFEDYLKEVNFEGSLIEITELADIKNKISQARYGSELWRLFLIIVLILAILEMMISRNTKKEFNEIKIE